VNKPGNYEVALGYKLMDLINNECGGMKNGATLKAAIPGGTSAPILTAEEIGRATLDYECLAEMGSMLGSGSIVIMDDSRCMVDMMKVISHFYHHESCGQCTPCREGTSWIYRILLRIADKKGRLKDIDNLADIGAFMGGTTICALADGAQLAFLGYLRKFRGELEDFIHSGTTSCRDRSKLDDASRPVPTGSGTVV